MSEIKGYFNGRQENDTNAASIFVGIEGETSDTIIPNIADFLQAAGRDYGILRAPALINDPFGGVDEEGNIVPAVREVEVPGAAAGKDGKSDKRQFHLMRNSDGHVVSPHTVTGQYAPLTLLDIAAEIQPWCDDGWVTPDAVYDGKDGSLELLCLRMDASGNLPNGEAWEHYIVFRNPHGSGGKAKGTIVSYRPMCQNVFGSLGRGIEFVVGHRISAKMTDEERADAMAKRVRTAKAAWKTAEKHIADLAKRINVWSGSTISFADAETLTNALLDIRADKDPSTRTKNVRDAILAGFSMPKFGTYGATLYDWLNAVTFSLSSPNCDIVSKSKVTTIDRMIRNVDPNGSGYKVEAKAESLLARWIDNGGNLN